ncbi:hypothetical protein KTE26_11535 [Ralstonia mannitolilytica]|uniref:hypothetical protein n=1 Tax=Ralstonia mannitolilytica TaxID=105219 RepID=UPI000CEDD944|nr:hypothetical protein [Ralstonia mannitolilytica]MBU9579065.1 hypothetical protein [Ralstonia mannitolilytica]
MDSRELNNAATLIANANVIADVAAVTVAWDADESKLTVVYYVDDVASEAARELCELTTTELIAQFSDIKLAATQCVGAKTAGDLSRLAGVVYVRGLGSIGL